jgi:catechol 2,3-dioxygenase-like lactoylglutathione lyase family enzyme
MYIDHVNIKATSGLLEKVRDFYCHVLGLTLGFRPAFRDNGYWLYAGEAAIIHLSEVNEPPVSSKGGTFDHFAIRVMDVSGVTAKLEEIDVAYSRHHLPDVGLTQLFFEDPAGNRVEVQCPDEHA